MKSYQRNFILFITIIFTNVLLTNGILANEMKAMNFSQKGEISELELMLSSAEVEVNKFAVKEDKQIIVDLKNTTATTRVMRAFDTSQFSGGVVFVKAYPKPNSTTDLRVAIQLRDNVRSILIKKNNGITIQMENRYGVFSEKKASEDNTLSLGSKTDGINNKNEKTITKDKDDDTYSRLLVPKSDSVEDILENLTQSGRKKYIGNRITLNLKNVQPEEILKIIADTSGFNIILTEDVKKLPPVSLNLQNIPWDQALDTVLEMNKLVAKKNGIILLVNSLETATKEKEAEKKIKDLAREQEPILTRIFPISFASIDELINILKEYSTEKRGKISKDSRTNSLIVKDTSDVIDRIKKIIEYLDSQTPQVLIEGKIVEISEGYTKDLGLGTDQNITGLNFDSTRNALGSFVLNTAPTSSVQLIPSFIYKNMQFKLNLMESETKGKVITSPRVITKNNVPAVLTQDEVTYFQEQTATITATGQPLITTTFKPQTATLSLTVTPQVTNEGSISMEINLSKGTLNPSVIALAPQEEVKRNVKTQVLVDNGSTVVIGGIYSYSQSESHSGIPYLQNIPVLGWLFRTAYNPKVNKKELIIFISPRIINQEEAGLVSKS